MGYSYSAGGIRDGALDITAPQLTGVPFNDAYRYMDWLLTVPLLLIEILLVMKLDEATYNIKAKTLGVGSALMIASGYYGELVITGDLTPRWVCWFASRAFFWAKSPFLAEQKEKLDNWTMLLGDRSWIA